MKNIDITKLKPSELIRVAIADLKAVRRDKRYVVDMTVWHLPSPDGKVCHVCLACAVMANTLKVPIDECHSIFHESDINNRLRALDFFRRLHLHSAFSILGIAGPCDQFEKLKAELKPNWISDLFTPQDFRKFYKQMNTLADNLEEMGY